MSGAIQDETRVVFVDPCNISDDGYAGDTVDKKIALTPEYEDMCIAFDLFIETFSRFDKEKQRTLGLSWTDKKQETSEYHGMFGGMIHDANNNQFLSTYYTEISSDSYGKKQMVEGLGVESVNISYDSYYTPTVVIKFVDVRGSALFGTEEAIHTGSGSGNITADSIFGEFFTVPYPKFRLRIKGFYGKDVTFQLTVTNFEAILNSKTGNMEATVTFVGYSWALLSNIPLSYLIAAPYCEAYGKDYWDEQVNNGKFYTDQGSPMPKLADFANNIEQCITEATEFISNVEADNKAAAKQDVLNIIVDCINKLNKVQDTDVPDIEVYKKLFQEMLQNIETFNTDAEDDIKLVISANMSEDVQWYTAKEVENTTTTPTTTTADGDEQAQTVQQESKQAYHINIPFLEALSIRVNEVADVVKERIAKIIQEEYKNYLKSAVNSLGLIPSVYNVFKLLMCHLETFCHILFKTSETIEEQTRQGLRTPQTLGLPNMTNNDLPLKIIKDNGKKLQLPPWTVIYSSQPTVDSLYGKTYSNSIEWVGKNGNADNWVEANVVLSLQKAIKQTVKMTEAKPLGLSESEVPVNVNSILTTPSDLFMGTNNTNPFSNIDKSSYSSIAGLLSIRASQIFGLTHVDISTDDAAKLGEADAINYMLSGATKQNLTQFFEKHNDTTFINIPTCLNTNDENTDIEITGDNKRFYKFEAKRPKYNKLVRMSSYNNLNDRYPIVIPIGDDYQYVYFYDKNNNAIIPTKFDKEFDFKNIKSVCDNDECYFEGSVISPTKYASKTLGVTKQCDGWLSTSLEQVNLKDTINPNNFSIITNQTTIENLYKWYKDIVENKTVKIGNNDVKADFGDFFKKCWDFNCVKWENDLSNFWYLGLKKEKYEQQHILNCNEKSITTNGILVYKTGFSGESSNIKIKKENVGKKVIYDGNEVDINDIIIRGISCCNLRTNYNFDCFTHPFYYAQENDYAKAHTFLFYFTDLYAYNRDKDYDIFTYGYQIKNKINTLFTSAQVYRYWYYKTYGEDILIKLTSQKELIKNNKLLNLSDDDEYFHEFFDFLSLNDINTYINLFEEFVEKEFPVIRKKCELYKTDGTTFTLDDWNDFNNTVMKAFGTTSEYNHTLIDGKYRIGEGVEFIYWKENEGSIIWGEDEQLQTILRSLVFDYYAIVGAYSIENLNTNSYPFIVKGELYRAYMNGFVKRLEEFKQSEIEQNIYAQSTTSDNISQENELDESILIAMYLYCKDIWEKWLLPLEGAKIPTALGEKDIVNGENFYDVENFFEKSFTFIDSFYNDIGKMLMINLDIFYERYRSNKEYQNLFSFLADIVKKHNCSFIEMPDFVHLGMGIYNERIDGYAKVMTELFKPKPYLSMGQPRMINNFVVSYSYPWSSKLPDETSYKYDGFDVYSANVTPDLFKTVTLNEGEGEEDENGITLTSFNVPAFGIAFGRQHNHLFKNFSISMDNPVETEHSIRTLYEAAKLARSGDRRVAFYGQDVYNIYTNYSYQIEVEMMGNAQIQPLMYFQLMNVPMWRGAYQINKVQHTITPGNMVTKFRGMKLSKFPVPILTKYWTDMSDIYQPKKPTVYANNGNGSTNTNEGGTQTLSSDFQYSGGMKDFGDGIVLYESYYKSNGSTDYFSQKTHNSVNTSYPNNPELVSLFNKLFDEILHLPNNGNGNYDNMKWNIHITCLYRSGSIGYHGKHLAMDLRIQRFSNGKKVKLEPRQGSMKEIGVVVDILYKNHFNKGEGNMQILPEFKSGEAMKTKYKTGGYDMLHVSAGKNINTGQTVKDTSNIITHMGFVPGCNASSHYCNLNLTLGKSIYDYMPEPIKFIAGNAYKELGFTKFVKYFTNFSVYSQSDLDGFFNNVKYDAQVTTTTTSSTTVSQTGGGTVSKVLCIGDSNTEKIARGLNAWGLLNGFEARYIRNGSTGASYWNKTTNQNVVTKVVEKWKPQAIVVCLGANMYTGPNTNDIVKLVKFLNGLGVSWVWIGPGRWPKADNDSGKKNIKLICDTVNNNGGRAINCWDVDMGNLHPGGNKVKEWVDYAVSKMPSVGFNLIKSSQKPSKLPGDSKGFDFGNNPRKDLNLNDVLAKFN